MHETLITSWRDLWSEPDLPFYFVQLANYNPGNRWELLREAQTQSLAVPNTGMALTIDIGDTDDIHPRNKQGTATRLAAIALAKVYGQNRIYSGPKLNAAFTDGATVTMNFDHVGSGLVSTDGTATVKGVELQGQNGEWYNVSGKIEGNTVIVRVSIFHKSPIGLCYGWESNPVVTLANQEGFPAVPFRVEKIDQTYFSWKDQLVGTSRLPTQDANGDGINNLMAYANASESPTHQSDKSGARSIPAQECASAIDVSLSLEQSNELKTWTRIWSDQQADANEVSATQSRDWGADLWDRYTVMLPSDPMCTTGLSTSS